jgi:MFS family permease
MMPHEDIAVAFLRWTALRAVLHRGYWLVTSLYLVLVADLSAFELVLLGTVMGITMLLAEVPTGVMADTISRKWSLVVGHVLMGLGMLMTGLVTDAPLILATQVLWGLGWAFSSGADVAWITDELAQPERIARVLTRRARWELAGTATGMAVFGALAWATDLGTSIVASGVAMVFLGLVVVTRIPERNFTPARDHRWRESAAIFRRGISLARHDREILVVLAATALLNGSHEAFGRLYPKQLVALGFPQEPDPIVWFTALGLVTLVFGALALRIVEARIDGVGAARWLYAAACVAGAVGLLVLAQAPNDLLGMAGVLLMAGVATPVTRSVSTIWVNRRVTSDVRATVHSFLSQAETFGEIIFGLALGALAQSAGIPAALTGSALLLAVTALLVGRSRDNGAPGLEVP